MPCKKDCTDGNSLFVFSTKRETFEDAYLECQRKGGGLATKLDEESYALLNSCCNSQYQYWIGLLNSPDSCADQNYQWVMNQDCVSADPLIIATQPNNQECQGVTIAVTTLNQRIPTAYETDCTSPHRYICKIPLSRTEEKLPFPLVPTIKPKVLITDAVTSTNLTSSNSSTASLNVAALVGGVLGFLLLFILFLFIYCRFCKNKKRKSKETKKRLFMHSASKPRCLPERSASQKSNHIYCT